MTSELDELDKELADLDGGEGVQPTDKKSSAKTLPIVVAAFALLSFAGIVFYAYHQGVRSGSEDAAPLLTPNGLAKIQPDDPGGLEVPHQDKLVYNQVEPGRDDSNVERLLPPPEDPMEPPVEEAAIASENTIPPIPSIIETPDPTKSVVVPALPAPKLEAPTSLPPTVTTIPETKIEPAPEVKVSKAEPAVSSSSNAKPWRIQLSAVGSDAAAKTEWAKQQKVHANLLSGLSLEIQKAVVGGKTYYRVRGGPLKDKKSAQALCNKLKAKKTNCIIVKPDV